MHPLDRARPEGRPASRFRSGALAVGAVLAATFALVPAPAPVEAQAGEEPAAPEAHTPVGDVLHPDGSFTGVEMAPVVDEAPSASARAAAAEADVVPLHETGPSSERLDLVFVGDGYTAAQLDAFHQKVAGIWAELQAVEPFTTYRDYINVWIVDVVSNESGVDDDPDGVERDTAMDMGVRCSASGIHICVDSDQALAFAAAAPEADQVLAVANSSVWGGSAYSWKDVSAVSGDLPAIGRVTAHELGHSMGDLGDEYFYEPDRVFTGNELSYPNLSIHDATAQAQGQLKWYQYLGLPTPDGGEIATFEGGLRHGRGIYRPSDNSIMRNSNEPFNLVGLDAMERAILAEVVVPPRCQGYETTEAAARAPGEFISWHPDDLFFVVETAGTLEACLDGPLGAEFNLGLWQWVDDDWNFVTAVSEDGWHETLTYEATPGYYRYGVVAASESGAGTFTVAFNTP